MSDSGSHNTVVSLSDALRRVEAYILECNYRGYDPFDLLTSPVFRLPVLRSNKLLRFGGQQVLRRIPFNVRPLLGIKPGYNPVTLGLSIYAYAQLVNVYPSRKSFYEEESSRCVRELERMQSPGYHGACWGYDFDWTGRYATIPAGMPTVVATGFITHGLFQLYRATGNTQARDLCVSSAAFVMKDLRKVDRFGSFCYSYSPNDDQAVLNATMKGARLLAQAFSITGDSRMRDEARTTVSFVAGAQRANGSWPYAVGDARSWSDNFHTAYVLDCLDEYASLTGDSGFSGHLERGLQFYLAEFFENGTIPRYYNTSTYPVDATSGAQSILTLSRFGHLDEAGRVAEWMVTFMQDRRGYFYYQKHPSFTNRMSYTRWSSAWMFAALASYLRRRGYVA